MHGNSVCGAPDRHEPHRERGEGREPRVLRSDLETAGRRGRLNSNKSDLKRAGSTRLYVGWKPAFFCSEILSRLMPAQMMK